MKTFEELKSIITTASKEKNACVDQYKRALNSNTEAELLQVIYDNLSWCVEHGIITHELMAEFTPEIYLASGIANTGKENTGWINSGNWNSGYRNSGYRNSGDRNSGDRNSGNWNSGDSNSGYRNSGNSNSGYRNSGNWNSGNWNSGDSNSGNWNSGYRNSGNWNSGYWNSGYRNSGYRNSGYRNSGDSNSGDRNSGNWNSGNWNSGNWNSGNSNSGDSNSGYRNSGAFCTDPNPKVWLFDQPTDIYVKDWEQSKPYRIMTDYLNPNIWIWENEMTEEQKEKFPSHKTTGGFLKSIPMKEAWANMWGNLNDESKAAFTSLPNFDKDKFKEITGIEV